MICFESTEFSINGWRELNVRKWVFQREGIDHVQQRVGEQRLKRQELLYVSSDNVMEIEVGCGYMLIG